MAELMFPDIAGSFMRGQQFGTQQRQTREADQRRSGLASLAQQAYTADPSQREGLIGQAIGIDPAAGMALGEGLQGNDDRRTKSMVNMAKMLTSAPEQYRAGLYQRMMPELQQMGLSQLPPQYDETVAQTAQAIVQAYGGGQGAEQFTLGPGSKRFNPDGSVVAEVPFAPANAQYVDVPDGQGGSVKMLLDPRSQQFTAPQFPGAGGQAGPMAAPAGNPQEDYRSLASMFGAQITSLDRSPADNQRVGGVANSQHMRGTAGDFVVPPAAKSAFIAAARSRGYEAIDEVDHVHLELPPGGGRGGAFGYTPPKSKTAPSGYRMLPDGSMEPIPGGPAQIAIDARNDAAAAKRAAEQAKLDQKAQVAAARQAEAATSANMLVTAIDTLTQHPGFKALGTEWGDVQIATPLIRNAAKDARAKLENIAGQVALSTMSRLKALSQSGATGFGSLTAPELKLLQNSIDTLQSENISNEQLTSALTNIRDFMEKTANWQPQQGMDFERGAPADSQPPAGQGGWSIQRVGN